MHTQTLMGIFLIFVHIIIITSFYYLQGKYNKYKHKYKIKEYLNNSN